MTEKSKEEQLYEYVRGKLKPNNTHQYKKDIVSWSLSLESNYGVSQKTALDVLSLKQSPDQLSRKMLYWILSVIDKENAGRFFTKAEIREFATKAAPADRIQPPFAFDVVEITDDQWIGKITARELIRLRDAGLIYYNPEAQRPFQRVVKGETTYVKININTTAVDAIDEGFKNRSRIPDTITLNIPDIAESEYTDGKLIIKEIEHFEILDGYHRFVALNRSINRDINFDYPMEIRFTKFPLEKERQFINQEDHKVPMKKVDAAAFDQTSVGNQIVAKLKEKQSIKNLLIASNVLNEGIIGIFIDTWYELTPESPRKDIVEVRELFAQQIEKTFDDNTDLENIKFTYNQTYVYCYLWAMKYDTKKIKEKAASLEAEIFPDGHNKNRQYKNIAKQLKAKGGEVK